ncbi:MAG: 2-isopropylmalate synthase [Thermoanaerobaculia bacterium]
MKRITVFDTTLRDGEQAPGCSMNLDEKVRMAHQLEQLGVAVIEAGFPISSDGDFESVRAVAAGCREATIAALCRTAGADIESAAEALEPAARPRLHLFLATSDIHLKYKLHKTRDEVLEMARRAVRLARSYVPDVEFSAEDATRSDVDFLCDVLEVAASEGATVLNVPDTVGYATPPEYASLVRTVRERVVRERDVTISVHCHNDLGLAVANTLAALDEGAGQVECTINGIGERAGNAALEEIVMACAVRGDRLPFTTGIRTELLYPTSQLLSSIIGFGVQPNKAIVGRNAFAHEAGIHQHGVMSNPLTYEIMTPDSVGVPMSSLVLGKHSGRHALAQRYAQLGASLTPEQLEAAYEQFVTVADRKKSVFDGDLLDIIRHAAKGSSRPARLGVAQ